MTFNEFKKKYLKVPVEEYPNNRYGKNPIVTVKLITYNHVNYIKECLDSILMQVTNFDFEILIAEDDSNDGTREICKQYADKYPEKIKLLLNSRKNNISINGKPTGTFNNTYANFSIKSKYIAFIEGDDYWTDSSSLQKRVNFLEGNKDHVLCFSNAKKYLQNFEKFDQRRLSLFKESTTIEKEDILNTPIPNLTLMFRNGLIETFDDAMLKIITGDFIFRGKLANFGKARYIHEIAPSIYRVHSGGINSGSTLKENIDATLQARFYLLDYFKNKNWDINPINESLANVFFSFFIQSFKREKKIKINYLRKSLIYSNKSKASFYNIYKNYFVNRKTRKM
jgi:glycosyltransferase involved in cell wall biosynthesis